MVSEASVDASSDGGRSKVSLKECLFHLAKLDSLLWRSRLDPAGAALLSVFLTNGDTATLDAGLFDKESS